MEKNEKDINTFTFGDSAVSTLPIAESNGQSDTKPSIEVDSEGYIGRDLFTKATKKPPRTNTVTFPKHTDWAGAKMLIKEIRSGEKGRIDSSLIKGKAGDSTIDTSEQDARYIIAAALNKDGSPMFNVKRDLATVLDMPSSCSEFLVAEIKKLFENPESENGDALGNSTGTAGNS